MITAILHYIWTNTNLTIVNLQNIIFYLYQSSIQYHVRISFENHTYMECLYEHKVDTCPCGLVVMSDYQRDLRLRLSRWKRELGLCNMSLGLWCAGVELGGGGRQRCEGQVKTCRADGSGAVKDLRKAWTETPGGRVTSCGGWHLGTSTSASVHGSDRVDRVKTADVQVERRLWKTWRSGGQGRRWHASSYGDAYGVRYSRTVWWFGPQNPDGGSEEERTACGGIEEFASRRNYLMKGAVAVGWRLHWVRP
jgi:hypothetical protein